MTTVCFFQIGKPVPKLKSLKVKDKNIVLPKTRRLDETMQPTHSIPSVAAIVPAEVPSFKKTVMGTRNDMSDSNDWFDRPTESNIRRHYLIHPTQTQKSSRKMHDNDVTEDVVGKSETENRKHKKGLAKGGHRMDRDRARNGDRRFLLKLSPDSVSIVPKSRHGHVHPDHVTGESRRRIHRNKDKVKHEESSPVDLSGILKQSILPDLNANKGFVTSNALSQGIGRNYDNLGLASLPLIDSRIHQLYTQKLQDRLKPTLDFTTGDSALVYALPASPNRLTPNSVKPLGLGAKRWERNRFKQKIFPSEKQERHDHNETESSHHHEYGNLQ